MTGRQAEESKSNEIAHLVGPLWSEAKVCDALGVDATTLATRRKAGTVLAPTTQDGIRVYPVFQFHQTAGIVEVRLALTKFLTALRCFDPWAVAVLVNTPAPELLDRTPLEWLRTCGDPKVLSGLASRVSNEWNTGPCPSAPH